MGREDDVLGYIKYSGKRVAEGTIDAKSAGEALIGLDAVVRFFNEKQARSLSDLQYEIPVRTQSGSWEALLLVPGALLGAFAYNYVKKAGEKMAEKDFDNVGLADVFRKSLSAVQYLIKLIKHTGQASGWDFSKIKWRDGNKEAGVMNAHGELLYIPAEFIQWFPSTPVRLIRKITVSVESERVLTVGVRNGEVFEEVSVDEAEKGLFDDSTSLEEDLDLDVVLPELQHGHHVELEGTIIRGNVSANSMGLEYQGHILPCIPHTGSVRQFKSAMFSRCVVEGTVNRLTKRPTILEKRPTIVVEKVTPLDHDRQHKLI